MLHDDVLDTEGRIDPDAWRGRADAGHPVGLCDADQGLLLVVWTHTGRAREPWDDTDPAVRWYTARCVACHGEFTSPNGRLPRRRRFAGAPAGSGPTAEWRAARAALRR